MGGYCNIGLIFKDDVSHVLVLEEVFKKFHFLEFECLKYPSDSSFSEWHKEKGENFSREYVFRKCYENNMSECIANINIGIMLKKVLIRIKHMEGGFVLLLEIPFWNIVFKRIDDAEKIIVKFLYELGDVGVTYAFCDFDADVPSAIDELNREEQYSIFIKYENDIVIEYAPWKMDGLSKR